MLFCTLVSLFACGAKINCMECMAGQAEPPAALQPTGHGARRITTSNILPAWQVRPPLEHCSVDSERPQTDPWGSPISKLEPADLYTTVGPSVCQEHTGVRP